MEVVLLATLAVVGLLAEVWQSARMTSLSLERDRVRADLSQQTARLEFDRADLGRLLTRERIEPHARRLELQPVLAAQVIELPATYLVQGDAIPASGNAPEPSWIGRVARALVPEATARSQNGR
jgi:hypothetical protein